MAQAFLGKFQLSSEEMATLRGARDAAITEVIACIARLNAKKPAAGLLSSSAAPNMGRVRVADCGPSVGILYWRARLMVPLCQRATIAGDE